MHLQSDFPFVQYAGVLTWTILRDNLLERCSIRYSVLKYLRDSVITVPS